MIGKKSLLVSLGILSCIFFGCGNNPSMPHLSNTNFEIVTPYSKEMSGKAEDILVHFHENTGKRFLDGMGRENFLKSTRYGENVKNNKKNKIEQDFHMIDFAQKYADLAAAEMAHIENNVNDNFHYRDAINKMIDSETELESFFQNIPQVDITSSCLEFDLVSRTIDLIVLGRSVERTEKIVTTFYKEFSRRFTEISGVNINFFDVCNAGGVEVRTDYGSFKIMTGVSIFAMESYFLRGKCTTKTNKDASLGKIISGVGDAEEARTNMGFKIVIGELKTLIREVSLMVIKKASPYLVIDPDDLDKSLWKNEKVTVADLKLFKSLVGENKENLVHFKDCFNPVVKEGDLFLAESNPRFQFSGGVVSVSPLSEAEKEVDVIWGKMVGQTQMEFLEQIAKKFNDTVSKKKKKDPNFNCQIGSIVIKHVKKKSFK